MGKYALKSIVTKNSYECCPIFVISVNGSQPRCLLALLNGPTISRVWPFKERIYVIAAD
jgi:hypothetical protein